MPESVSFQARKDWKSLIQKDCFWFDRIPELFEQQIKELDEKANAFEFQRLILKVLDPILWSTLHFSTPLRPNHRRHTFTTAATVCLGCGLSLNVHSETYQRIGL